MEGQAILASYNSSLTNLPLVCHQCPYLIVDLWPDIFKCQRAVSCNFARRGEVGPKAGFYAEINNYICLKKLGKPVKWIEDRQNILLPLTRPWWDLKIACDNKGRISGVRVKLLQIKELIFLGASVGFTSMTFTGPTKFYQWILTNRWFIIPCPILQSEKPVG